MQFSEKGFYNQNRNILILNNLLTKFIENNIKKRLHQMSNKNIFVKIVNNDYIPNQGNYYYTIHAKFITKNTRSE